MLLLFQQLGPTISVSIAQTVFLNKLLPYLKTMNPNLTVKDIIQAGATGLKELVTGNQLPRVLVAYATSLRAVFIFAATLAVAGAILSIPIEWKSVRKDMTSVNKKLKLEAAE